ncbi:MAG TPA: beta-galactosidase [Armatimonadetes bacterium]|nr:beta-galactosidase [Armatimonadota bacterium]
MSELQLRFRQVHLDFHTGPAIRGVGSEFEPGAFAETLVQAHVDSITCFARCHHGFIYYNSRRNPERLHPGLTNASLLLEQIHACHERGIRVPIYTTVQWDDYTADERPEWLAIEPDGRQSGTPPFEPGFYRNLDIYHPGYRAWLREHVEEILTALPTDGLFFDICQVRPSCAPHWLKAMDQHGIDPTDATARQAFASRVLDEWEHEMTEFVHSIAPDCTVFYNSGHVGPRHRPTIDAYTHYEIESLPSGGWGYLHFPQTMRYARRLGNPCLAMTGKFHTSWGDFSSYKSPAALEYECFSALALGAQVSVGDQLPPAGALDPYTYELIGDVFAQIEAKEPWCVGAETVSEVAVFTPEAFIGRQSALASGDERNQPAMMGATRMLTELQVQFDIVDEQSDLSGYRLVILPDIIPVDDDLRAKLEAYLEAGGAIMASYASALAPGGMELNLPALGVASQGEAPLYPDFLVPGPLLDDGLPAPAYVMYRRGLAIEPQAGAQVLASRQVPYHNRTWRAFCSHRHTPNSGRDGGAAVVRNGACVYFAHPVFSEYQSSAAPWVKQAVANALAGILPAPLVQVEGPSSLLVSLTEQPRQGRRVLHLLHYIPERRAAGFDVIEDVIPLFDLRVRLRAEEAPSSVQVVPDGESLEFSHDGTYVEFVLPRLDGHALVEVR